MSLGDAVGVVVGDGMGESVAYRSCPCSQGKVKALLRWFLVLIAFDPVHCPEGRSKNKHIEQEHRMGSTDLQTESDELFANYAVHMDKREEYGCDQLAYD